MTTPTHYPKRVLLPLPRGALLACWLVRLPFGPVSPVGPLLPEMIPRVSGDATLHEGLAWLPCGWVDCLLGLLASGGGTRYARLPPVI